MFGEIKEFAQACWKEVLDLADGAAVYIDHPATECLHWHTGDKAYLTLKDAGAVSVHELALYNFHNLKAKNATKALIISTSTDTLFYQRTLKVIIEKNNFQKCYVVCTAHKKILQYTSIKTNDDIESANSYDSLKDDILYWMNDKMFTETSQVTMIFKPIFIACLKKDIFVTPPFGNLIPSIDQVLLHDYEAEIDFLISSFHTLFSYYNVTEDVFYLGKCGQYVAEKMNHFDAAVNRRNRNSEQKKVSLIFVDRLLDLSTATSHNSESMMGKILCTLPHLSHHYNDVAINMQAMNLKDEESNSTLMVPGCLANSDETIMKILFNMKQKEVLTSLNKMLIDMSEGSPKTNKSSSRISAHSLEKGLQKFRETETIESLCNKTKNVQLISAVVQALKSNKTPQIDFIISLEKLILQNLAVSGDSSSILSQLSNIVKTRASRGLDMDYLLALIIHLYAMAGPDIKFTEQQEKNFRDSMSSAIYEDINKCNETDLMDEYSTYYQTLLLLGITNEESAREISDKITDRIMNILHKVLNQREMLQNYKQVMHKTNPREMARHVGLLEQLITDLLDEKKPEIPDIILASKSSNATHTDTKAHPCENSWVIIYVLGGITPDEINIIENIINSKNNNSLRITVGGTRLLSPLEVVDKILLSNITNV
ncbi:hypothetical protein TKK_0017316 [Trichogramma kaykai]|uniref:Sec1 family domain-containing protein 2 n=1 Tax=Trichogramma kaykai TaxID=54128 RepID=A0ABD2W3X8_9HYME